MNISSVFCKKISEMEKLAMLTLMIFHSMMIGTVHGDIAQEPESVERWFKNLPYAKEKVTKLHFFFHDIVAGPNPSSITVAQASTTRQSRTGFGLVRIMDDALTVGPDSKSKKLGGAQGIYASASLEDLRLLMTLNFVFTSGKYNGSTLSVLGHNPVVHEYRELAIVGGSGVFRLARGVATAKTVWFNLTTLDAVVEYHVLVLHY